MERLESQDEVYFDRLDDHHTRWANAINRLRARLDEDDINYTYFDGLR